MKKDIEWLKAEIDKQAIVMDKGYIYTSDLIYLIDSLDEPEVLSQEFIDEQRELETKIQELIESYKQEEDAYSNPENGWISGFIEDLKNLVEEEQRYYVLFGSQSHDDNWTYALTNSGSIEIFEKDVLPEWDRTKLTEQEIKDYDPRYMVFAIPVEEGR